MRIICILFETWFEFSLGCQKGHTFLNAKMIQNRIHLHSFGRRFVHRNLVQSKLYFLSVCFPWESNTLTKTKFKNKRTKSATSVSHLLCWPIQQGMLGCHI